MHGVSRASSALGVAAFLAAFGCMAAPGLGAQAPSQTREQVLHSAAPGAALVRESLVRIHDPLPASAGPHPAACDFLQYLRFRDPSGPAQSSKADAVFVIIPGFLGGAGSFDQVARNTIRDGAQRDQHFEFWALDRRANCLEDHTGIEGAARARDASVAYGYYWGSRQVSGKRFGGFKTPEQTRFLSEFGLERTVRDWYAVLRSGIPDQRVRARKVICGGHSLGGPLTAAFASWDFDGDPSTTADAGYNQCAGLLGLDTTLALGGGGRGGPGGSGLIGVGGQASPYVNTPPLTPETFELPAVFGVGAFHAPQQTGLLKQLPHTTNIDLSQKLLFSRDAANFATGMPGIRDFTLSNEAVLGGVFDDNSAPLSFLRSSVGFLRGGPVAEKSFPAPDPAHSLAIPADPKTPLYAWDDYDKVGAGGAPIALNSVGQPFTTREGEISDIHQLARTMFEAPADFIEQYFPTRILTDVAGAGAGDRSGSLSGLRYDGPNMRPAMLVNAGDSNDNAAPDSGPPAAGAPPNTRPLSRTFVLPGYNHLDMITAARTQNDGRPEPTSEALTKFALDVIKPAPKLHLTVAPGRVREGSRVRFHFRVRSRLARCVQAAAIRIAGYRVRTGRTGRASLALRLSRRSGRRLVTVHKQGCRPASATVRVLPARTR